MLNTLSDLGKLIEALGTKSAMRGNAERLYDNIKAVAPEWESINMLVLLTPSFQEKLFHYVAETQQRSEHTIGQRRKSMKAVVRDAIQAGFIPNIPLFSSPADDQKEIKRLQPRGYKEQMRSLMALYYEIGETIVAVEHSIPTDDDDAARDESRRRCSSLAAERRLLGLALLSVLLGGIDLRSLAVIRRKDVDGLTLTLADGVAVELPEAFAAILDDLSSRRREYVFDIVRPSDSPKKQARAVAALAANIRKTLAKYRVEMPMIEDPLLVWSIVAQESGAAAADIRKSIEYKLSGRADAARAAAIERVMRKIATEYADMTRSWYCFACPVKSPSFVRSRILKSDRCPAQVEFFMPRDIIHERCGGKMVPVENPFFARMLFVGCNFYEARRIEQILGNYARLYGFTDSDGKFHCRITCAEKDLLQKYVEIESHSKIKFTPDMDLTDVKVLITSGKFKGMFGTILRHHPKLPQSDVALEMFGRPLAVIRGISDKALKIID